MMVDIAIVTIIQLAVIASSATLSWCGWSRLVTRKTAHVFGGVSAAVLPNLVSIEAAVTVGLGGVFGLALLQRRGVLRSIARPGRTDWGVVTFPLGLVLSAIIFWGFLDSPQAYQCAVIVMGVADAAAGYFGKRFGRTSFGYQRTKTAFGSLTFYLSAVFTLLLLTWSGYLSAAPAVIFLLPLFGAVVEAYSPPWLDNVSVPLATGAGWLLFL